MKRLVFIGYEQLPKAKRMGVGTLVVSREQGDALFMLEDGKKGWRLERVRLEEAGPYSVKLSGMEEVSIAKDGRKVYRYQEWLLVPEDTDSGGKDNGT